MRDIFANGEDSYLVQNQPCAVCHANINIGDPDNPVDGLRVCNRCRESGAYVRYKISRSLTRMHGLLEVPRIRRVYPEQKWEKEIKLIGGKVIKIQPQFYSFIVDRQSLPDKGYVIEAYPNTDGQYDYLFVGKYKHCIGIMLQIAKAMVEDNIMFEAELLDSIEPPESIKFTGYNRADYPLPHPFPDYTDRMQKISAYISKQVYGDTSPGHCHEARKTIGELMAEGWQDLSMAMGLIEQPTPEALADEAIDRIITRCTDVSELKGIALQRRLQIDIAVKMMQSILLK